MHIKDTIIYFLIFQDALLPTVKPQMNESNDDIEVQNTHIQCSIFFLSYTFDQCNKIMRDCRISGLREPRTTRLNLSENWRYMRLTLHLFLFLLFTARVVIYLYILGLANFQSCALQNRRQSRGTHLHVFMYYPKIIFIRCTTIF